MSKMRSLLGMGMILLILTIPGIPEIQDEGQLQKISVQEQEDFLRVLIYLNKLTEYKKFRLDNPPRLVIDFLQVKEYFSDSSIPVQNKGVRAIRVGKYKPDITRVVFDLTESLPSYEIKQIRGEILVSFWFEEEKRDEPIPEEKKIDPVQKEKSPPPKEKGLREEEKKEEIPSRPVQTSSRRFRNRRGTSVYLSLHEGFYFMHSGHFQEVYGKSMLFVGGEVGFRFPVVGENNLSFTMGFTHVKGYGQGGYKKSRLQLTPVSLSVIYLRKMGRFTPYIGAGLDYFNYSENSPEVYADPLYSKETWGGHIKLGAYIKLFPSLSMNIFGRYLEARFQEDPLDLDLGGNEYGLSLSYHFQI